MQLWEPLNVRRGADRRARATRCRARTRGVALLIAVACSASLLLGCSVGEEPAGELATGATATSGSIPVEEFGQLRSAAEESGVGVGTAVDADALQSDDAYRNAVATNFTSVTPENAMKWTVIRPGADEWDWAPADEIVDFAEQEGLDVRGHTLVWGQDAGNGLPEWLREIEDPEEFRVAVEAGIREQVGRYRGRVDRWDVVNEPLDHVGAQLNDNVFLERLGPGYIGDAFRAAAAADPDAELWLNDFSTEIQPDKADALVELVEQLVQDDVPIDGVGFQTHLNVDVEILPDAIAAPMERIRDLGLDVAITELDVPIGPTRSPSEQVELYERAVEECLSVDCVEITVWGVADQWTWLDDPAQRDAIPLLQAWSLPSEPLLLDAEYQPKSAYSAVVEGLRGAGG